MGFKGKVYVPDGNSEPSFPVHGDNLAKSIFTRVVTYYATVAERDIETAVPTKMSAAEKLGMRCYVADGPAGYGDWCGWDGDEWIWDRPAPILYTSGTISGTNVNTPSTGHNPSIYTFTPARTGYADVRVFVSAQPGSPGYGSGHLKPRFGSGAQFPGAYQFVVLNEPANRKDDLYHYPVPILLTKGISASVAFDLASFNPPGGWWVLNNAQWLITLV